MEPQGEKVTQSGGTSEARQAGRAAGAVGATSFHVEDQSADCSRGLGLGTCRVQDHVYRGEHDTAEEPNSTYCLCVSVTLSPLPMTPRDGIS